MSFFEPFRNPRVSCRDLPAINLELWKERVSCSVGTTNIDIGGADRVSPCVMCTCTKEGVSLHSIIIYSSTCILSLTILTLIIHALIPDIFYNLFYSSANLPEFES